MSLPHAFVARPAVRPGHVVFGFTAPTTIYEKMRSIDRAAQDLNTKIHVYSRDANLKAAWERWYTNWQTFWGKYSSDWTSGRLGALFYSDELNAQTDEYWKEYTALQGQYQAEREPGTNKPLPPPSQPLPEAPPTPTQREEKKWTMPWWGWALLAAGGVGVGLWLYWQYKELSAGRKLLNESLPSVVKGAAGRDPSATLLAPYAARAEVPQAMLYQPYEHPHLVAIRDRMKALGPSEPRGALGGVVGGSGHGLGGRDYAVDGVDFGDWEE